MGLEVCVLRFYLQTLVFPQRQEDTETASLSFNDLVFTLYVSIKLIFHSAFSAESREHPLAFSFPLLYANLYTLAKFDFITCSTKTDIPVSVMLHHRSVLVTIKQMLSRLP